MNTKKSYTWNKKVDGEGKERKRAGSSRYNNSKGQREEVPGCEGKDGATVSETQEGL